MAEHTLIQRDLASVDLEIGAQWVLETRTIRRKAQVQLLGYRARHSLMISAPMRNGSELLLERDEPLALRFMSGKTVCAFESRVIFHSYQPYSFYHIAYPEQVETLDVRNSVRVKADIFAEVDSEFVLVGDWPKTVKLVNLSESGLCFVYADFLGLLGHELIFTIALPVQGATSTLFLKGVIRNIEHRYAGLRKQDYLVGVEFIELDAHSRLVLSNYVLAK